jgi:hypothetical protein
VVPPPREWIPTRSPGGQKYGLITRNAMCTGVSKKQTFSYVTDAHAQTILANIIIIIIPHHEFDVSVAMILPTPRSQSVRFSDS